MDEPAATTREKPDAAPVRRPRRPRPAGKGGPKGRPPGARPRGPRGPRPKIPQLPDVPAWAAALATGLLAGLAGVLLVVLGLLGCEALRGAPSCGDVGYPLLTAIIVGVGLGAMALLRFARVADAGVISFIAVCLVLVVLMLGLIDVVFSAWMWALLPGLCAAAFVATTLMVHALTGPADRDEG